MNFQVYAKAIVALIPGLVALVASHFGFKFSPETETAIVTLITAGIVYYVPNQVAK
jgi:hypothetical protein